MGYDPMRFLALEGVEQVVAQLVVEQAAKARTEELEHLLGQLERVVQNGVAKAFGAT